VTANPTTLRRRGLTAGILATATALLAQAVAVPVSPAGAATPAISYTYDGSGRLATVTTAAGTATYHYDAVGNVTSITRSAPAPGRSPAVRPAQATPRIGSVTPKTVRVGRPVTISGSGFGRRAAEDVVRVGPLMARVLSATDSRLVIAAPPGSGGRVIVHTPGGTATGGKVVIRGAPKQMGAVTDGAADRHPLRAAAGVTALAGQVETSRGAPLAGVRVSVSGGWGPDGYSTVTDSHGQFLLSHLDPGRHRLTIDGSELTGGRDYGVYSEPVELPRGRTSVLPWISYLTPIAAGVPIASPTTHQVTLTTSRIPGLKVLIPAGTVIRDRNGNLVRSLSITRLPTARTPMPWGPGMVPAYFTIQPGDATVSGPGLQVIYPNSSGRPPGEAVSYLAEDPSWAGSGWYRYGGGHVSADGREVLPDPTTRYGSTDPGGFSTQGAPGDGPPPGGGCQCGDPVDLPTGLFSEQATDISLPDIEGITFTRNFRQLDDTVRDFGIGGSDSLNLYIVLTSSGDFELVMPDGGGVTYTPTGTTGQYQAVNTPTDYAGSTLTETTSDADGPFTLKLRNGTQMAFGNPAFLTAVTDRYGNTMTVNRLEFENASQGGGEIQTVTTPNGRWLQFTYGVCIAATSTKCVTQITDNSGRTLSYTYNTSGQLTSVTNTSGGVTSYGWAACTSAITCTELTSITDPLGRVTKITYDATTGRVTQTTEPNGGKWQYAYTLGTTGAVTKTVVTDPDGNKSSSSFATNGYATSNTTALGTSLAQTSTATFGTGTGLVKSTTDALGDKTTYTYDALGNPLTITRLAGTAQAATTTYTYDPTYSRITSITDPLGRKTTTTYNDSAGTETVTSPLGGKTVLTVNDQGQTISVTDPRGNITDYSYLYGLLVATANPLGNVASTYYNSIGQPVMVGYPDGSTSSYTYDAAGRELTGTDPLGKTTTFSYDADGEPVSYTDANGHKTAYTYDSIGDPLTQTDPLGKTATWTYDADGNTLTSTDRDGNVTKYAYNALGLPSTTTYGVTGTTSYDTVTTAYDKANRPTTITDSRTGSYTYAYDNFSNLTNYTSPQGSISYTYNADRERTGMTVAGQPAVAYSYNANDELTKIVQGSASTSYSYDADGNLTGQTLPNGVAEASTYDAASELTGTTDTASGSTIGSVTYTYDVNGQVASATGSLAATTLPAAVSSETYNAGNELTKFGATSLTYDGNGNLTSDGTSTYAWNPMGALASATTPTASYTYTYNPAGQRVTSTTGGTATSSLYDGATLIQQSRGGSPIANYLAAGPGATVQVQNSAGTSDPLVNPVGSTTNLTGGTGKITTTYSYDPAGNTTVSGTTNPDPEQYATGQTDPTGLDLMGARYYDPALGRFISQDPFGISGGSANLYEYALDDPVGRNDPTGMCGSWCQGLANFGAGVLNGLSFGLINVPPPFCGPGNNLAYGFGNLLGQLGTSLALIEVGGPLLGALGESLEAGEEGEAASELFYRTMSQADFEELQATGSIPATSETFISPSLEYASRYEGVTVQFSVDAGTTDALAEVGVRDSSNVVTAAYPDMPAVSSGWTDTSAFFKGEGGIINIGLGQGTALDIFNSAIQSFEVIP
jgi:RHS repeat-associated protein